jgi:hypothetical protein
VNKAFTIAPPAQFVSSTRFTDVLWARHYKENKALFDHCHCQCSIRAINTICIASKWCYQFTPEKRWLNPTGFQKESHSWPTVNPIRTQKKQRNECESSTL